MTLLKASDSMELQERGIRSVKPVDSFSALNSFIIPIFIPVCSLNVLYPYHKVMFVMTCVFCGLSQCTVILTLR